MRAGKAMTNVARASAFRIVVPLVEGRGPAVGAREYKRLNLMAPAPGRNAAPLDRAGGRGYISPPLIST
jgi:hypothetical protein